MESATAAERPAPLRTRFGRTVRAPTRYEPVEVPLDDDSELEFSGSSSEEDSPVKKRRRYQLESEDDETDDESDVGSLKDFVVSDGEVEETDTEDEAEEELFDSEADSETEAE